MNLSFSSVVKFLILNLFPVISLVFVVAFGLQLFFGGERISVYGLVFFLLSTSIYHATTIINSMEWDRNLLIDSLTGQNRRLDKLVKDLQNELELARKNEGVTSGIATDLSAVCRKNDANEKLIREMSSEILNLKQRLNIVEDVNKGGF